MNALSENKIVVGTLAAIVLLIGLWGVWKLLNGSSTPTQSTTTIDLKVNESDWQMGPASASATLVEYSDFQCPACKAYAPIVKTFVEKNKEKVKFVYRNFPLQQHQFSKQAAYFAEAAGMQGKFFEMHDKLFDGQEDWEKETDPEKTFLSYAKELKLDIAKLQKDVDSKEVKDNVEADLASGNAAGVDSTPSFYMNGKKVESPKSVEDFENLIK
ncbi:MAG TPA: thioredoxin domain-containing protein [Acidimicrobiia bacterium]|nr:thioredoxin domain-containing protein [Acidimicrobiia bacterium]